MLIIPAITQSPYNFRESDPDFTVLDIHFVKCVLVIREAQVFVHPVAKFAETIRVGDLLYKGISEMVLGARMGEHTIL